MLIAVTNTVRKKGRLLCHVAERTFTSGRMAGGRVAIFVAEHLAGKAEYGICLSQELCRLP